jgi:DNA-binding transcriptional LysR family regulator
MLMELRHLYTFQMIVKEGSFLQAAEKLQYAQSTITLHVQQLEAELGVKLFARQGKKIELTEAGRALRDQLDHLLQRAQALQQAMIDVVAGEAGHLRLGSIEPTASLRLPSLFAQFYRNHPKVHLTLEVGGTNFISRQVAHGKLDVGICSPPPAHLGLAFEPLFVEMMELLLPESHPLVKKEAICPEDLAEYRLLLTEPGCAYRALIENELLQQGTNPYSGIEISSLATLVHMVQSGLGLAIVPTSIASPPPEGTVLRVVHEVDLGLQVGLVHTPDNSSPGRALKALFTSLRTHLQELDQS